MEAEVLLSVDRNFKPEIGNDDRRIVGSLANQLSAWKLRSEQHYASVTLFDGDDPLNEVRSFLPTILERHPDARTAVIKGLSTAERAEVVKHKQSRWVGTATGHEVLFRNTKDRR